MEKQEETAIAEQGIEAGAQAAASEWQWCGHCGRASISKMIHNCGYEGCDAGIETVFTWKYVRGINPDLPVIPVRDVVYSMNKAK